MELIYMWVEGYRNINQKGFNFSPRFKVDFSKPSYENYPILSIRENDKDFMQFEGKIEQITAIIGKNGSGKTNILDLLGAKRYDRQSLGSYENLKYFFIYHIEDNIFAIEGSNFDFIKHNIKDYSENESRNHISEPYSIILEKIENHFFYKGFLQFAKGSDYKDKINFFNYRHHYSEAFQHYRSMTIENEPSHLFNRINLSPKNTGKSAIYQMIIDLNKKIEVDVVQGGTFLFGFQNSVYLKIKPSMHLNDNIELKMEKGFIDKINILDKESPLKPRFKYNPRENFINQLLYKFCHSLASQFFLLPQNDKELSSMINNIQKFKVEEEDFHSYYFKIIETLLNYQGKKDKYFKNKQQIIEIIEGIVKYLSKLDQLWFKVEEISIPLKDEQNSSIKDFLKLFDSLAFLDEEVQSLTKLFSINFSPFSAGEEALISLFAGLHHGLNLNYNQIKEKAIILLDEPDNFMHPEWCRLMVKELCSLLNRLEGGYKTYQLIITTHSPFIISDLPKENVIALEKDPDSGECRQEKKITETFAANIHTLLAQDFFMKSTIGEFAKSKINSIVNKLNRVEKLEQLSFNESKEIDYIISIIGEPLIKHKLEMMAEKVLRKEETIKQLKARLRELEDDDPNKKY